MHSLPQLFSIFCIEIQPPLCYNRDMVTKHTNVKKTLVWKNFLKKMNDICGHEADDSVLMRVVEEMRHIISSTIHGYRLGGDEFALIFCNYSEDNARSLLREWENGIGPVNEKDDPIQCSLAIGCAFSDRPTDIERVLKEADHSMYDAKLAMKALRTD